MEDLLSSSYDYFLRELRQETDPERKAWLYLRCAERSVLLLRRGDLRGSKGIGLDLATYEGLKRFFRDDAGQFEDELGEKCERLRAAVSSSLSEEEISEDVLDELFTLHRSHLDHGFIALYMDRYGKMDHFIKGDAAHSFTDFKENLTQRMATLAETLSALPCPTPVAEKLQQVSRELFVEGNPLFSWWDTRSDSQKVQAELNVLTGVTQPASLESQTAWDLAPSKVKAWDVKAVREIAKKAQAIEQRSRSVKSKKARPWAVIDKMKEKGLSPADEEAIKMHIAASTKVPAGAQRILAFLATVHETGQVPRLQRRGRLDTDAPVTVQAEFTKPGEGKWILLVFPEDPSIVDQCWRLRVEPKEPLLATRTGGRILTRLIVSQKSSREILCESIRKKGSWQVQIPIERVEGLRLLLDMTADLAHRAITEISQEALTLFFDWLLTS